MSDEDLKNPPHDPANPPGALSLRRWHVALAAGVVAAAYLACVHGQWWPTSDSALYVGLGRSLAHGGGYRFNSEYCNYVTPGLSWLFMLCHTLGGENEFLLAHLAITLGALACLWLIYATLTRLTGSPTALAVAVVTAGSSLFLYHANMLLTDVPFMAVYWGLLYTVVRCLQATRLTWIAWLAAAGALAALGVVLRAPGLTVIGPLAAGVLLQVGLGAKLSRRAALAATLVVLAGGTALAFLLIAKQGAATSPPYIEYTAGKVASPHALSNPLEALTELARKVSWPIVSSKQLGSDRHFREAILQARVVLGAVLMALGVLGLVRLAMRRQLLLVTTLVLTVLILLAIRDMRDMPDRYLLPISPIMSLAVMWGLLWLVQGLLAAPMWIFRACAALYRRIVVPPNKFTFDLPVDATVSPNPQPVIRNPGSALGRVACTIVIVGLVAMTLAANALPMAENFALHAYYGRTDRFRSRIGNGSLQGLTRMADSIKALPANAGPVTCFYAEHRILHLLSGRVVAYPLPDKNRTYTLAELREFMGRAGSRYLVVGDEDEEFNLAIITELVNAKDFKQVRYEHACYFFKRLGATTRHSGNEEPWQNLEPEEEIEE